MKAHLLQMDLAWEDRAANFAKVERLLERASPEAGDFVLLPEMFDSGFSFNTSRTADAEGKTLEFLGRVSRRFGVTLQGARTMHERGTRLAENRAPVFGPDGALIVEYAKIHPFTLGRESEFFQGGREVVTYPWRGRENAGSLMACPAICYDLRFPELFRIGLSRGAEMFALEASWPEVRQAHWRALLVARAIENQAFVLGVNRTGRDPNLVYAGGSIALGPKGEMIGELGAEEGVLSVEIEPGVLHEWRAKFPAWRDGKLKA
jgi:predicted amidohydrolase